ncbi:MAG: LiaF-related protein, partial [Actinomycetota bacterium]|nr:LiaF-related protein [Actinomycetota bacterium]
VAVGAAAAAVAWRPPARSVPTRPPVPPTPHWNRGGFGAHAPSGPAHAYEVVTAAGPPPEPRSRSIITPIVLSALAVLVGLAVLLDRWSIASPDRTVWWAAALAIVALGLFVSAWAGRARGLVALALFLSAGLVIETTASPEILFSAGERIHEPRSLEGTTTYELGAGEMRVDLSGTDFGEEPATVEARVQAGELTVIVPDDVDVEIVADATMGELTLFGENTSGIGVDRTIDAEDDPDVLLDLHVGMGTIVVDRVPAAEDDAAESEGTTRTTSERGDGTSATAVTTPAPESSTPSPESSVPPTTAAGAS